MTQTSLNPAIELKYYLPQSPLALVVITIATTLLTWDLRHRTRRVLKTLTDSQLDDIGLSRVEAYTEARRSFWQS